MNKKIENLIAELKKELKREDVGFVIATCDISTGDMSLALGGSQTEIGLALMEAKEDYTDEVKKNPCPCLTCQMVRQMMDIDIYEHSEIEIDEATFNAFMNGGNSGE